jgi:phosphoglycolate phosphatase
MIFPGLVEALQALAATDQRCAIVTNKPEGLTRLLLHELDLARACGAIVGGDNLQVCKPDPRPLHYATGLLGADIDQAVMIGDSSVDAQAAAAAGVPFLLFEGGYGVHECDGLAVAGRFGDFAGLPALIGTEKLTEKS